MRIFITGATGFVGSAVVKELLGAGHQVLGLVRSDAGARALAELGAEAQLGALEDLEGLTRGAARADAVIHTAFNHDFSRYQASCDHERRVVDALGAALVGTTRPLVVTSALGVLPQGVLATEESAPATGPTANPRVATEQAADLLTAKGVRVSVVRLPPSTHGDGDPHFSATLIKIAREKRVSAYIEDGANRWPAVHRLDAASLYRLVVEKSPGDLRFHAVAEEGIPLRHLAHVVGERLGVPVVSKLRDEAAEMCGGFARFAALDVPASAALTQERTGWVPQQPGLLADLEHGRYLAT